MSEVLPADKAAPRTLMPSVFSTKEVGIHPSIAKPFIDHPFHLSLLRQELERRQAKNPSYSLRAFARSLGIDPGALSAILNQRRPLSEAWCDRLVQRLGLSAEDATRFRLSVLESLRAHKMQKLEVWGSRLALADAPPVRVRERVTLCLDPELLEEAKQRIEKFREELQLQLRGGARSKLFSFEVGLYSLDAASRGPEEGEEE